jgi:hypothetical protein
MLCKFKEQVSSSSSGAANVPPYAIRASDLDKNFALCYPVPQEGNNSAYSVVRSSDEGWRLVGGKIFNVCENGKSVRYRFFAERLPDAGA